MIGLIFQFCNNIFIAISSNRFLTFIYRFILFIVECFMMSLITLHANPHIFIVINVGFGVNIRCANTSRKIWRSKIEKQSCEHLIWKQNTSVRSTSRFVFKFRFYLLLKKIIRFFYSLAFLCFYLNRRFFFLSIKSFSTLFAFHSLWSRISISKLVNESTTLTNTCCSQIWKHDMS